MLLFTRYRFPGHCRWLLLVRYIREQKITHFALQLFHGANIFKDKVHTPSLQIPRKNGRFEYSLPKGVFDALRFIPKNMIFEPYQKVNNKKKKIKNNEHALGRIRTVCARNRALVHHSTEELVDRVVFLIIVKSQHSFHVFIIRLFKLVWLL